jgi:diguanylate cyclase (GGDEF)-like protein
MRSPPFHFNLQRLSHSLVTRALITGLLVLTAGTVASYWQITRFLTHDVTEVVASQQMTLAGYVARDVEDSLNKRLQILQRLAASLPQAQLQQSAALQAWLVERHALQPFFSIGFLVIDVHGRVLASDPKLPGLAGRSLAAEPEFDIARSGATFVGRPRQGGKSRRPLLPFAVPVLGTDGAVRAVLVGLEEIAANGFLSQVLQGHGGQAGGLLLISPKDKVFVASTQPEMVLKPTPPVGVNLLHDRAMLGFRGVGTTVNAQGVEEISAMASVPRTGWFVVARLPTATALAPVARVQQFILSRRVPVMMGVLVLISLMFAWLLRPLFRAATLAERMSRGDAPLAPLPVARNDEVGHLTAAFNRLLATLGEKQAELERLAHHDNLTGLPNRKLLQDRLQQALRRASANDTQVVLLFLDLDGFKRLNDTLGHEAGDEALRVVARRLGAVVRPSDTVARFGGDEFVLLLPDFDPRATSAMQALANKCAAAVAKPFVLGDAEQVLGVSVGIACSRGEHTPETLLAQADQAMYRAKLRRTPERREDNAVLPAEA